ncbi:hypothetical protein B5D80_27360 [Micromonospora wenchangensis]|uniref:Uncharacterized protein n=1 Tax=Micromonospora wenchangensis TaxID=1185415 RepID=A0A246RG72_9ACTN|nr:hypothetical protein [Micromonospora wenchangensis]OWV00885.1 hypothetical protein B5D80_27360 [Micromonospora wenchangensis]
MRARVALVAAGALLIGYAVAGALTDPELAPAGVLVFLAGVLVGHDVVWMAGVLTVGALLARFVPRRHRPVVRAGVIGAAALTVVALPLVLGFGRPPDDPSVLPLPYGRNLAVVLLLVAAATAVACLPVELRHRRRGAGRGGAGARPRAADEGPPGRVDPP